MPDTVSVLDLSFNLPAAFADQTERYVFTASPWEFVQRLEIIPVPQLTEAGYLGRFQEWLEMAYGNTDAPSTESRNGAMVITCSVSPDDESVDVVSVVRDTQPPETDTQRLELRFLAGEKASTSWTELYGTVDDTDASLLGWTDRRRSVYAVRGIEIDIPETWQDTTDYVFTAGADDDTSLVVRLKWEDEPDLSPRDRVQFLLAQVEASDPSSSIVEDAEQVVDSHDAHIGVWEGRATDTVRHEFIAIRTRDDRGAHLYASGLLEAFEAFGSSWNDLRQSLEVL